MTHRDSAIRTAEASVEARGIRIAAEGLTKNVRGAGTILHDVSLTVEPGELVAIVGGSGAGKSTLLEALAGVSAVTAGRVTYDGIDLSAARDAFRTVLGYVPQDDIIHTELPLERTLRYAARLRLAADDDATTDMAVRGALERLDLLERAGTRVSALSGGQRKRASIAVEMLTRPKVFFLDEPTSGLDPATSAGLLRLLRRLADTEATIVFTTHAVQDLTRVDRVVFLAPGGRVAFVGSLEEAREHFGAGTVEEIYERLAAPLVPVAASTPIATTSRPGSPEQPAARQVPGPWSQWRVLSARTFESMVRNRLTLAILLGSPVMVVAMFAILFQPGAFDIGAPSPTSILMILFWISFGGFFFGLTYGLLQIVTERPILRREHLVGLRVGPYLLSKVTVLLPFLLFVNVLMLAILRGLDRLPAADLSTYSAMTVTLTLGSAAALTLGLLASAAVGNATQAILALPMLCFPAVLFSGAILPVAVMAPVGAAISTVVPVRWAFEAVGAHLAVRDLLLAGGSPLGPPLVASYGAAGTAPVAVYWAYLASFALASFVAAWLVLSRTAGRSTR